MADGVWYVAYGSNLSPARFQRYLDRCDDPSCPRDAKPGVLPHRLFFAHESGIWTGGTAFVDPVADGNETLVVSWLIGLDQFRQVLASENGRSTLGGFGDDLPTVPGDSVRVLPSRYGLVVAVESPDDRPAYTFTTGEVPLPPVTRPAVAYVDTIVSGLGEFHDLDEGRARSYLAERGGSAEVGLVADAGEQVAE